MKWNGKQRSTLRGREREGRKNSRSSRRAQFVYLLPLSQNIYLWKSPLNLLEWYCKSSVLGSWFCAFRFLIFHFHFTLFTFHIPIYLVLCFVLFCFLVVAAFFPVAFRVDKWFVLISCDFNFGVEKGRQKEKDLFPNLFMIARDNPNCKLCYFLFLCLFSVFL